MVITSRDGAVVGIENPEFYELGDLGWCDDQRPKVLDLLNRAARVSG